MNALLDQIGQGQQTINAANDGLTGITSLLQQALSTVQQAQQASQHRWLDDRHGQHCRQRQLDPRRRRHSRGQRRRNELQCLDRRLFELVARSKRRSTAPPASAAPAPLTASDNGTGDLVLTANSPSTSFTVSNSGGLAATLGLGTTTVFGTSSARTTLQANYNSLLSQINQLAGDSSYNGVNLLGGNNLTIDFNPAGTSSLTISGVNFNAAGLSLSNISGGSTGSFQDNSALNSTITSLNSAITQVQTQTETFGTNSGVIGTRQSFTRT